MKFLITAATMASLVAGVALAQDAPAAGNDTPPTQGRVAPPLQMFDEVDANSDGVVTPDEIAAWKAARFAEVDGNGDGKVDAAELAAKAEADRVRREQARAEAMVARLDANGDGVLTADELDHGPGRDMLGRIDADGDGNITRAEAEAAFARMKDRHGKWDRKRGDDGHHGRDRHGWHHGGERPEGKAPDGDAGN